MNISKYNSLLSVIYDLFCRIGRDSQDDGGSEDPEDATGGAPAGGAPGGGGEGTTTGAESETGDSDHQGPMHYMSGALGLVPAVDP